MRIKMKPQVIDGLQDATEMVAVLQLLYKKSLPTDLALGKERRLQVWLG